MIHLLFVDDEVDVLEGLENRLRRMRARWSMHFAQSGTAALAVLDEHPIDVIVSDMRMPEMDGATLLDTVRERYPRVVRFMLSGETGPDGAVRGLPVAHQFLSKPCDLGVLERAIDRVFALFMRTGNPRVQEALGLVQSLPTLPRVYRELLDEIDDPDSDTASVAEIVERSPSMCARVLQIANSAFFSGGGRIAIIREAVALLGLSTLRGIALSNAFFHVLDEAGLAKGLNLEAFDQHSQKVAYLASRMLRGDEARLAYSAGMLHDIGELVLAGGMPDVYADARSEAIRNRRPLFEMENELIGCSHADIGSQVLALWGLPAPLIDAVAHHHMPSRLESDRFDATGAVHIAQVIAGRLQTELPPDPLDVVYLEQTGMQARAEQWIDEGMEELR